MFISDDREIRVRVPVGSRIFISPYRPDRLCVPPSSHPMDIGGGGGGGFCPGVKWLGCEADHSPPTSA
jgi:hypothetical protein